MPHDVKIGTTQVNSSGPRLGDGKLVKFEPASRINTSVKEASDVIALPGGLLGIVSDTKDSLTLIDSRGREKKVHLQGIKGVSQLEGITYDPVKQRLFVAREEARDVLRYSWDPKKNEAKFEKRLETDIKGPTNKGIEGLAYLSESISPTGEPQLLAAKEGNPRELRLYKDSGKGDGEKIELEPQVKDVLKDFSALAVDPKTGHIFISSDESSVVAQVRLVKDGSKVRARLIQAIPIRTDKDKPLGRIEGITFNAKGDLYVLTENNGTLYELKRN